MAATKEGRGALTMLKDSEDGGKEWQYDVGREEQEEEEEEALQTLTSGQLISRPVSPLSLDTLLSQLFRLQV